MCSGQMLHLTSREHNLLAISKYQVIHTNHKLELFSPEASDIM